MRRFHRRFHILLWVALAAGVVGGAFLILNTPKPDITETFKPATE